MGHQDRLFGPESHRPFHFFDEMVLVVALVTVVAGGDDWGARATEVYQMGVQNKEKA